MVCSLREEPRGAIDHGCGLFYLLVEVNGGAVRVIAPQKTCIRDHSWSFTTSKVDFLYLLVVLPILIYCLFWKTEREKASKPWNGLLVFRTPIYAVGFIW